MTTRRLAHLSMLLVGATTLAGLLLLATQADRAFFSRLPQAISAAMAFPHPNLPGESPLPWEGEKALDP